MPAFQFYINPEIGKSGFTYLQMGTSHFLNEKVLLLEEGFEVDGDPIFADSAQGAVDEYQFGIAGVIDEYAKSDPSYALVRVVIDLYRSLFRFTLR
ncbi:hypothetical protein [Vibrio sp. MA40-2]|uniref:hypothetical protein n=1 Tax=Vibrio sp. MA40-2 TaxID=3391828 RepID=UPI0039A6FD27